MLLPMNCTMDRVVAASRLREKEIPMSQKEIWNRIMHPEEFSYEYGDFTEFVMQCLGQGFILLIGLSIVAIVLIVTSAEWRNWIDARKNRYDYRRWAELRRKQSKKG